LKIKARTARPTYLINSGIYIIDPQNQGQTRATAVIGVNLPTPDNRYNLFRCHHKT